jgi:hypothetical protein
MASPIGQTIGNMRPACGGAAERPREPWLPLGFQIVGSPFDEGRSTSPRRSRSATFHLARPAMES